MCVCVCAFAAANKQTSKTNNNISERGERKNQFEKFGGESIAIAIAFSKYTAKLILIETDLIVSVGEREKKIHPNAIQMKFGSFRI